MSLSEVMKNLRKERYLQKKTYSGTEERINYTQEENND